MPKRSSVKPPAEPPPTGFRHLGDRSIHDGKVWRAIVGSFEAPDGARFERDIVRSRGAVAVIALLDGPDGSDHTVLVRQYRPPFDRTILEIPAGLRDVDGEPDIETARRELVEEVGLDAAHVELLTSFLPQPGMSDSVISICLATACTEVSRAVHGPEEQHMEVVRIPVAEAVELVRGGEITDAKTVIALLWLECFGRPG